MLSQSSNEELDELADSICSVLRAGTDENAWLIAVKAITDGGIEATDAGRLIRYAASFKCVDAIDRLPSGGE